VVPLLGLMIGGSFTPALVHEAPHWAASLAGMAVYTVAATALVYAAFRRVAGMDPVTAYFAAAPGGLTAMILTGRAMGGDERIISLVHVLRIVFVVLTIPVGYQLLSAYDGASATRVMGSVADLRPAGLAVLVAAAVAGILAGRLMRLPTPGLTGPMLLFGALHVAGITMVRPPAEVVLVGQLVMGATVGARFAGLSRLALAVTAGRGLLATALMLALAGAASLLLAAATGLDAGALMLAFAPGGLVEMSLISLAMDIDPAFVAVHHMLRIILVVLGAPLVFRLLGFTTARRQ